MTQVNACDWREMFKAELREILPDVRWDDNSAESAPPNDVPPPYKTVDECETELAALCLSGGGIRSASFSLGILQGLARFDLLGQFHYLSTVSGGGYIGSWLSAWRSFEDDTSAFEKLNALPLHGFESPQITGLQVATDTVAPSLDLTSPDTWMLSTVYLRNLVLNWVMFVPFFAGCLFVPRGYAAFARWVLYEGALTQGAYISSRASFALLLMLGLATGIFVRFRPARRAAGARWLAFAPLYLVFLSAVSLTMAALLGGGVSIDFATIRYGSASIKGAEVGFVVYACAWLIGRAPSLARSTLLEAASAAWGFVSWIVSGAIVGSLAVLVMLMLATHTDDRDAMVTLGPGILMLTYFCGEVVYIVLLSLGRSDDADHEWFARISVWFAIAGALWSALATISLYGPRVFQINTKYFLLTTVVCGILTLLLGQSDLTAATQAGEERNVAKDASEALKDIGPKGVTGIVFAIARMVNLEITPARIAGLSAFVFAIAFLILLAFLEEMFALEYAHLRSGNFWQMNFIVMPGLVAAAVLISSLVNVNRFSVHAVQRSRLARTFLGSARAHRRTPSPITGDDPADDVPLTDLTPKTRRNRLFHVINATLNITARTGRKRISAPFTFTRLHCGNPYVGYLPTATYGEGKRGISLGTAMSISGAAESPDQGYNSSPLIDFILMLFNVRLGWWLPNPRVNRARNRPFLAMTPALEKLFGLNTDSSKWLFLSDGGHFENLGLYEMIRRRCRIIVVVDAGLDPNYTFDDLGNAARKVYTDFGVRINFERLDILSRRDSSNEDSDGPGSRFAVGSIAYPGSPRLGWLLYIKPTYYGTSEGVDVRSYGESHPKFPQESASRTADSELKFEAYRALGAHIIEEICSGGSGVLPGVRPQPLTLAAVRQVAALQLHAGRDKSPPRGRRRRRRKTNPRG
jgi:Patatin-like phospholipase